VSTELVDIKWVGCDIVTAPVAVANSLNSLASTAQRDKSVIFAGSMVLELVGMQAQRLFMASEKMIRTESRV